MRHELLDRPCWSALTGPHADLSERVGSARRYQSEYTPFIAAENPETCMPEDMLALVGNLDAALVETQKIPPPDHMSARFRELTQLVGAGISERTCGEKIRALSGADQPAMYELAHLTKPGPFRSRTHELGRFMGIFEGDQLIAMAGERMRFDTYIEISAVCTHPDYRGRGFGAALISHVGRRIEAEGKTPFLHSNADNDVAIGLYQSLGFRPRRNLWHTMWERRVVEA